MAMKLSTGIVAFPIQYDNGDKEVIHFNPHDKEFKSRIEAFEKKMNEKMDAIDFEKYGKEFEDGFDIKIDLTNPEELLKLSPEQRASLYKKMEVIESIQGEYNEIIKKELDEVFKSNVSKAFFKYCEPLDEIIESNENGEEERIPYVKIVLTSFLNELSAQIASVPEGAKKHLSKYMS